MATDQTVTVESKRWKIARVLFITAIISVIAYFLFSRNALSFDLPSAPIVAYRIAGSEFDAPAYLGQPHTIEGYAILQEQSIADPKLGSEIISLLQTTKTYGGNGATCFEPGIALRFGEGDQAVKALVCLACRHIYFYKADKVVRYTNLSDAGIASLKKIYAQMFPGHSADTPEDDYLQVRKARKLARQKLDRQTTQPTTLP